MLGLWVEPELRRTLNGLQMFAISFASVSVVIGVFATYDDAPRNAGAVGIWPWPVVGGQLPVALVIQPAERGPRNKISSHIRWTRNA